MEIRTKLTEILPEVERHLNNWGLHPDTIVVITDDDTVRMETPEGDITGLTNDVEVQWGPSNDGGRLIHIPRGSDSNRPSWLAVELATYAGSVLDRLEASDDDIDEDVLDLIGVAEAARILGITGAGVRKHTWRGTMPAPLQVAGATAPIWRRRTIEDFATTRPGRGRSSDR